jgi:hypothetical protein
MSGGAENKSTKPSALGRAVNLFLAVIRGPFFLFAISMLLLTTIPTCQATLLKGYVSTYSGEEQAQPVAAAETSAVPGLVENEGAGDPGAALAKETPMIASPAESVMQQRAATLQKALVSQDSFPRSFVGYYRSVTLVVDSGVTSVPVGQRVESQVGFLPQRDGRIVARWDQPGWTEAQENIMPVSDHEAELERTNYFIEQGPNGWAAHSHDHYLKIDDNRIAASSEVEQYIDGRYLGKYATKSMLYKLNESVAMR